MNNFTNWKSLNEEQKDQLCCYGNLSVNFIKEHLNEFTESQWYYILTHQKCIDSTFLREYGDQFNIWEIYCNQCGSDMTFNFIDEFKDKINWETVTKKKLGSKDYDFFKSWEKYVDINIVNEYLERYKLERHFKLSFQNSYVKDKKMVKVVKDLI